LLGAKVPHGPADIPEVGRFAVVMDLDGAVIDLFRPSPRPGETPPSGMPGAGDFCWETLSCKDPAASSRFYEQVTGWKTGPGPGGATVFLAGGAPVANVITAPPGAPPSWMTYVAVERLTASRDQAVKLGAKLIVPEAGVPEVGVLSVIADPSGAVIGLFQGERRP
jgi:predicted enzyme related to lactoylglutathione lyase